jgi:hypothetical protein
MKMFASVLTVAAAAAVTVTVVALLIVGPASMSVSAQTPLGDYYDTTKLITLKGTLRASTMSPGQAPTMLLMEAPDPATGTMINWFIAARPAAALQRAGIFLIGPNSAVKSGDVITVSAYVAKPGPKTAEAIAAALQSTAMPGTKAGFVEGLQQKDAKVLHAIEIVTAEGKTLAIGEKP